jgi:hypothetical protein
MGKYAFLNRHFLEKKRANVPESVQRTSIFQARNTCWYCNAPLNSMGRYCDKGCAQAFEEDDSAMARHMQETQSHMSA